jgi:hypothetical protein
LEKLENRYLSLPGNISQCNEEKNIGKRGQDKRNYQRKKGKDLGKEQGKQVRTLHTRGNWVSFSEVGGDVVYRRKCFQGIRRFKGRVQQNLTWVENNGNGWFSAWDHATGHYLDFLMAAILY